ncbi:sensor histidine kinase [Maribacter sp. MAR_2009_72]|uniref:sensor histidine kinase n=1 Tax=Maribacter sp. MAR_2009_72 TaxID=1250050 RepID=UPI00119B0627|nr:HAMP domain-containing sensor histidine kinase [Maribacter sp. MAR_2009_72]TVZ16086.1 signal transduction histidine kinase [Maribacter sp. MAR_2009_72]
MKLLNHTTKYFAILLIVLISVWAVIFYVAMIDEVYDSLDDGLENQKEIIIQAVNDNPELLNDTEFGVNNYTIKKTQVHKETKFKDSYRDTLMYMQNEEDYEPVRILESVFEQDGSHYKLKLITSMVEEDDQIQNLFIYLVGLYLALILSILVLNNFVMKRIWKPFYKLIGRLKTFRIEKDDPITSEPTNIDEFNLLNLSVERLTEKSRDSYLAQKEFIENAAHELQTPLAIAINKLELLLEKNGLTIAQSQEVGSVLDNLTRLTRLNKSLLLLSKIDNKQYIEEERIDFSALMQTLVQDFTDFATHKDIDLKVDAHQKLTYAMNPDLAVVLMTNLIKNAIVHGQGGKPIHIEIVENQIRIQNYGENSALQSGGLFERFRKASADSRSTGLGLSIAKAIADKYDVALTYSFTDRHEFTLTFP